jgi:hypothetical protein
VGGSTQDEEKHQCDLIRDILGYPYRPVTIIPSWLCWNDGTVVKIAQSIYDERRFEDLPILADALEDAGCDNEDILAPCRQSDAHVRGCWVVDLILGKEGSRSAAHSGPFRPWAAPVAVRDRLFLTRPVTTPFLLPIISE